jgi:hypothetical protein
MGVQRDDPRRQNLNTVSAGPRMEDVIVEVDDDS